MASSTTDNAMSRFLFAILKQKNLRDIDWNQVAKDPVLVQEISNGHAARMRFSRFKTSVVGPDPNRRNRSANSKNRVTKSKKDPKAAKDAQPKSEPGRSPAARDDENTDGDSQKSHFSSGQESDRRAQTKIKQERLPYGLDTRLTPGMTPGTTPAPTSLVTPHEIESHFRFLTPASETDPFTPGALAPSPTTNFFNAPQFFNSYMPPTTHDATMAWQSGMPYSALPAMYDCDPMVAGQAEQHLYAHQEPYHTLNRSIEVDDDDYLVHDHDHDHDYDHDCDHDSVKDEECDHVA